MSGPYEPGGQPPPFGQPYEPPTMPGQAPTMPGGMPSAPGWGYGQPAPPSQYPTAPGQPWGPGGPTMPGGYAPPPPAKRRSLRWLWISLGVVVALLLAGGGAGLYALGQYTAPAVEAGFFCGHMKAGNYAAAYNDLSAGMQAEVTGDEFAIGAQFIAVAEGSITRCQQSAGNAYTYSFGAKKATLNVTMTRSISGTLAGNIGLVQEGGAWKIGSLDTSLLGINLGALKAAGAFCAAMQAQNYPAAYALLSSSGQKQAPADLFATVLGMQDQIDGKITSCSLTGFTVSGSDSSATLNVSFNRATLGTRTGTVSMKFEGGAWKVDNVADSLSGTDVTPVLVLIQFCNDLVSKNYEDAYSLATQELIDAIGGGRDGFIANFTLPDPYVWTGCTQDLTTFKLNGDEATVNGTRSFKNTSTGTLFTHSYTFYLFKEGGAWKYDGLKLLT
jgi:hypothetical protein